MTSVKIKKRTKKNQYIFMKAMHKPSTFKLFVPG